MDKETFWTLLHGLQVPIYRFALSILKDREEAADTVHDMMIKLWDKRENLPSDQDARTRFVFRATKNFCIDKLRKKKDLVALEPDHSMIKGEHLIESKDLMDVIKLRILGLPLQQRMVIELKDFQGYGYEEISEILETPIPTLRVNLSRARKYVVNVLENERARIK